MVPSNQYQGLLQQPLELAVAGSLHPPQQALLATLCHSLAIVMGTRASRSLPLVQWN